MKDKFIRHIYYPLMKKVRGHKVPSYLKNLIANEQLPPEELKLFQNAKLLQTLRIAAKTPYYKKLFRENGFDSNSIDSFNSLPVTSKDQVRVNPEDFHNPEYNGPSYFGRTSGSTGISLPIKYDSDWDQWNQAAQSRGRSWWNVYPGDRELDIWGRPFDNPKAERKEKAKMWMLNKKMISCFQLSDSHLDKITPVIVKFDPDVIYGYTTGVGRFAEYIWERYGDNSPVKPKTVFITSETLFEQHRAAIKNAFGIMPANEYGCAEGGIIAFDCAEGNMHVAADRILVEIESPDSDGYGRVVITPFMNIAMPLIRFDLGDIGRYIPGECRCGRKLPLFELAGARVSEMIVTKRGTSASSTFFDFMAKSLLPKGLRQFRAIQKSLTHLHLQMVQSNPDDREIEDMVRSQVVEFLGDDMMVTFEYLNELIPDESGKLRYFVKEDF